MKRFRLSSVLLIFRREVRDQLRDRRTLFMIGVLPLLLYPLIGMSFMQMAQLMRRNSSSVLIVSSEPLLEQPALVADGQLTGLSPREAALIKVEVQQLELASPGKAQLQAGALIENGQFDAVVWFPPGFVDRLAAIREDGTLPEPAASEADEASPGRTNLWSFTVRPRTDRGSLTIASTWRCGVGGVRSSTRHWSNTRSRRRRRCPLTRASRTWPLRSFDAPRSGPRFCRLSS